MTARRQKPFSPHRPAWLLLALLVAALLVLGGGILAIANRLTADSSPGARRYVEAVVGVPSRINPLYAYRNETDRDLSSLVFSGLTRLGPQGEVLPDLAESWEISPDSRTFTFYLRPNVTWHGGSPFTAADVVFTYGILADPQTQGDPDQLSLWQAAECLALDELTVQCYLPQSFSPFLAFTTTGIVSRAIFEAVKPEAMADSPLNQAPVGTGPFRLVDLDRSRAILKANPAYHLGRSSIDEVEIKFYPNTSTAAAALRRQEAQGLLLGSNADNGDLRLLGSTEGLKAYSATRNSYTALFLNNRRAPFNDPAVRNAVARSLDIDALIGDEQQGRAVRGSAPIVPGAWANNPSVEAYPFDRQEARAILDGAGWVLPPNTNVRQKNGAPLELSVITDKDPVRSAIGAEIAAQLEQIGFRTSFSAVDAASLVSDFLVPRDYQAAVYGWEGGVDPDPYAAWHSSQGDEEGHNLASYSNQGVDRFLEQARAVNQVETRKALYFLFQHVFYREAPSVVLFYPTYTYFVDDDVGGIELGTFFYPSSRFSNLYEWKIEGNGRIPGP